MTDPAYCPECGAHRLFGVHALRCYPSVKARPLSDKQIQEWESSLGSFDVDLAAGAQETLKRRRERAAKTELLSMIRTLG